MSKNVAIRFTARSFRSLEVPTGKLGSLPVIHPQWEICTEDDFHNRFDFIQIHDYPQPARVR